MYLTFFLNRLNNHQVHVADEFYTLLGDEYCFVEICKPTEQSKKGSNEDFSRRPYLLKAWEDESSMKLALRLAIESKVAVFGAESLVFEVQRMKSSQGLAFELSERWLKRGWINFFSPRLLKYLWYYKFVFRDKPLYKLCAGAYCANDMYAIHSFVDKCYKWGYFTKVDNVEPKPLNDSTKTKIMWCGRFLKLKHPELPVFLAERLHNKGYQFVIDMYGSGEELNNTKTLIQKRRVEDFVKLHGTLPNEEILKEMRKHDVFLFTSDRNEGWGAVVNEAMANGCAVVISDEIGSSPYLIEDGVTGMVFSSCNIDSLEKKVVFLLTHKEILTTIGNNALRCIKEVWNPRNASSSLLILIEELLNGAATSIKEGPCSKAEPIIKTK